MTLSTYDELKSVLVEELARSDVTASSAKLDRFIKLAEKKMDDTLRVREMVKDTTLSVSSQDTDLPDDFIEIKAVRLSDSPQALRPLPEQKLYTSAMGTSQSRPHSYAISYNDDTDRHVLRVGPVPSGSYTANLDYYAEIPALSDTQTTNEVLLAYPDIYLTGCLRHAFRHYRNFELASAYKAEFGEEIALANGRKHNTTLPSGSRTQIAGTAV